MGRQQQPAQASQGSLGCGKIPLMVFSLYIHFLVEMFASSSRHSNSSVCLTMMVIYGLVYQAVRLCTISHQH